jgi:hypothetical protein
METVPRVSSSLPQGSTSKTTGSNWKSLAGAGTKNLGVPTTSPSGEIRLVPPFGMISTPLLQLLIDTQEGSTSSFGAPASTQVIILNPSIAIAAYEKTNVSMRSKGSAAKDDRSLEDQAKTISAKFDYSPSESIQQKSLSTAD